MTDQVQGWVHAKTTVLGSKVTLVSGVLTIIFAFAITGQQTLFNLIMSVGGLAAIIAFAIGLLLLRRGAGPRASAGFLGFVVSILILGVAYTTVDPMQTAGSALQGLDLALVLVGDVAALVGGVLLWLSLGSFGANGPARLAGYTFFVGGVIQMMAAVPDAGSIITESSSLGDVGHVVDGLAGIVYVVAAPLLLYLAVRRAGRSSTV